jgi:hypothetical protein
LELFYLNLLALFLRSLYNLLFFAEKLWFELVELWIWDFLTY